MLSLTPGLEIFFCAAPANMRRSFDGLARMAEEYLAKQVFVGGLFVFVNKRRDRLKLLWFDGDGYCLWYKRLEEGTFQLPTVRDEQTGLTLHATDLSLILGGVDLAARCRKRYRQPA